MPEPVILASRRGYEPGSEVAFDGTCPNCKEPLDEPSWEDIHIEPGEFIAITRRCACKLIIESFYDWDRTEMKVREQ